MSLEKIKAQEQNNWGFRRILGIIIACVVLLGITAGVVSQGKQIYSEMKLPTADNYLETFLSSSYEIYRKVAKERAGEEVSLYDIYFKSVDEVKKSQNSQSLEVEEDANSRKTYYATWYDMEELDRCIYTSIYLFDRGNLDYGVIDHVSGWEDQSNIKINFLDSIEEGALSGQLKEEYEIALLINYDNEGKVSFLDVYGISNDRLSDAQWELHPELKFSSSKTKTMTDVSIVLGIREGAVEDLLDYNNYYYTTISTSFLESGFLLIILAACFGVFLLAVLLMVFRLQGVGNGFITRIPIEIVGGMIFALIFGFIFINQLSVVYFSGDLLQAIKDFGFTESIKELVINILPLLYYGICFLFFAVIYIVCMAVLQLFRKGIKKYLIENCLVVSAFRWCTNGCKKIVRKLVQFDIHDNVNKTVFKITAVNFILIAFMCSIWFFGWGVLIIYSVVLFILLRKYIGQLKEQYNKLLTATSQMAQGNLNINIQEDLGLLNPLKEELEKVQEGFSHALEEEVKSQNMRNELITNVSHDLKTPLTAIIAYVDLLKNPSITEEQREEYIQTLERKSQRLKQLIEDLFEVSKLNSNNVQLQFVEVDLISLIKQVMYEYEEKLSEGGIELRATLPEEKIVLHLDSQKTYRIFENLFGNVMKYALAYTRAYLDVEMNENQVIVYMRNISNHEISRDKDLLTERFVRGDESRNTEGSGLGLAIVKSLVEKQGGKFEIIVDGDLFKTILTFPRSNQKEQEETVIQ